MTKITLPGLAAAAFLTFGAVSAHASAADEVLLGRLSGVNEITQTGVVAVNFVQGRLVLAQGAEHIVAVSAAQAAEQADRYFDGDLALTLGMLIIVALAYFGVSLASRKLGRNSEAEAPRADGWKEELMSMLEADLTNMDGLKHGFSSR